MLGKTVTIGNNRHFPDFPEEGNPDQFAGQISVADFVGSGGGRRKLPLKPVFLAVRFSGVRRGSSRLDYRYRVDQAG